MANVLRRVLTGSGQLSRYTAVPYSTKRGPVNDSLATHRKLKSVTDSLADRGFLRSYKPYSPPDNVKDTIVKVASTLELSMDSNLTNMSIKFELLKSCSNSFGHQCPNSILHEMRTVQDVIQFYSTPVDTTLPLDRIQNMPDLPSNLHIQQEYVRFQKDDPMFQRTAFPKSSTLVSGIATRRKYKGYEAKRSWY